MAWRRKISQKAASYGSASWQINGGWRAWQRNVGASHSMASAKSMAWRRRMPIVSVAKNGEISSHGGNQRSKAWRIIEAA